MTALSIKKMLLISYLVSIVFYSFVYYLLGKNHIRTGGRYINCLYFSTTIMSTVGFGDITPQTDLGKCVVMSQQLLTIMMAGILITDNY
jgi:hypothetical protein